MIFILDWLIEIRQSERKTQQKLANKLSISRQAISAIENSERRPSVETAKRIAKALNFDKYGLDWTAFFEKRSPPSQQSQSAVGE